MLNVNESKTYQDLWDERRAEPQGNFSALNAYIRKEERLGKKKDGFRDSSQEVKQQSLCCCHCWWCCAQAEPEV